jgi:IS30 family transposase
MRSRSLGVGLAPQAVPSCHPCEAAKIVASKLILDWSPEQISGWLKTQYPDDESLRLSHETIYHSLFIQARVFAEQSDDRSQFTFVGNPKLTGTRLTS